MNIGTISQIWRYPVKSLLGESLDQAPVDPRGLDGDRAYALIWPDRKIASGKTSRRFRRLPGLFGLSSYYREGTVGVRFPDGEEIQGPSGALDNRLADHFGELVKLERESGTSFFDASPAHILTTSSLNWLKQHIDPVSADLRRFRPNIVVDSDDAGLKDSDFIGRTMKIGLSVALTVTDPTERCVMTTLEQSDLPKDTDVLDVIAKHGNEFGVYAAVSTGGEIKVGDRVTLI